MFIKYVFGFYSDNLYDKIHCKNKFYDRVQKQTVNQKYDYNR